MYLDIAHPLPFLPSPIGVFTLALSLTGCAVSADDPNSEDEGQSQPIDGSGGSDTTNSGGGAIFSSGGTLGSGGLIGTGGIVGSGGLPAGGGTLGAGGSPAVGGAPGTGGRAETGGGPGSGDDSSGGSGNTDCGVEPANQSTNQTARRVLCYLYEIYGESTLSGQQDCHFSESSDLDYINARTGKYPAIVGGDFLYDNAVSQAVSSWNAGGLSMIRYHMGRPEDADSYESSLGTTDLADTLTPGTARYNGLMAKFDHAASELALLQDSGVVVLWAPFHETQPNGWFWWSKGTGEQLQQLWRMMFDDFTARGLNNLIWLFPFSGQPNADYYPGTDYVDIAGPDTYGTGQPYASMYQSTVNVVGSTIPIPLHEVGNIPNPQDMFQNNQAPWVLFNAWCDTQLRDNSDGVIQAAYSHSRTLNRGDLPSFD